MFHRTVFLVTLALACAGCESNDVLPPPTTAAAWGVPDRPIRVVAYNVQWHQAGVERVADVVKRLEPDVVLLSEVPPREVAQLADAIGLPHRFATPSNDGNWAKPSTAVLSRFPLANGRAIENPGGSREPGVMVEAVAGGKRFCLAAVHLTPTLSPRPQQIRWTEGHRAAEIAAVRKEWEQRGSPPLVVGGDFNQVPLGPNYVAMTDGWTDGLASLGKTDWTCQFGPMQTRVDYVLTSSDWRPTDAGVADADASDHRPIWAVLVANSKPLPTTAATRP